MSMINKDGTFDMSTEEAGDGWSSASNKGGDRRLDPTPIAVPSRPR